MWEISSGMEVDLDVDCACALAWTGGNIADESFAWDGSATGFPRIIQKHYWGGKPGGVLECASGL